MAYLIQGFLTCLLQGNNSSMKGVTARSDSPQKLSLLLAQS